MAAEPIDSQHTIGLDLPTIRLQRISGPVSMFYLKPKKEVYDAFHAQGLDLPLFLLFGDEHRSEKGMCEDCECLDECCKLIYDKDFLRELDTLARETPVDFYTESAPSKDDFRQSDENANILFKDFIDKTVRDCHQTRLRTFPEYIQKCPTKWIRWHYGDIRYFSSTIEGFMLFPLKNYINRAKEFPYRTKYDSMISTVFKSSIHGSNRTLYDKAKLYNLSFLSKVRQPLSTGDLTTKEEKLLDHISSKKRGQYIPVEIIQAYSSTLLQNDFVEAVKSIQERFKSVISEKTQPYVPLIAYILNQLLESSYTFRSFYIRYYLLAVGRLIELIDEYYTFLLPFKEEKKSGIFKQLEKQSVSQLQDISFWRNLTIENTIRKYTLVEQIMRLDLYQRQTSELFTILYDKLEICLIDPLNNMSPYSLRKYMSDERMDQQIKNIFDTLTNIIRSFNSNILDAYTLTRVFKTPVSIQTNGSLQKETQPTLSLGFFGDSHTNKIVWALLSSPFHYELSYYQSNHGVGEDKRCLLMDEVVPLVQDVAEHHEMRFGGNDYEKSNQYYSRLRREQHARIQSVASTRKKSIPRRSTRKKSTRRQSIRPSLKK